MNTKVVNGIWYSESEVKNQETKEQRLRAKLSESRGENQKLRAWLSVMTVIAAISNTVLALLFSGVIRV